MSIIEEDRFLVRGGTAAKVAALNEVPLFRELVIETDTGMGKEGDGVTHYNSLLYTIFGKIDLTGLADGKAIVWDAANLRWKVATTSGGISSVVAGTNVTVNNTDPMNPVVSAIGGGGGVTVIGDLIATTSGPWTPVISGFSLDLDFSYEVQVYAIANGSTSGRLILNGDNTIANYRRVRDTSSFSDPYFIDIGNSTTMATSYRGTLSKAAGLYPVLIGNSVFPNGTDGISGWNSSVLWKNTADVTSFGVALSNVKAGSRIRLLKF